MTRETFVKKSLNCVSSRRHSISVVITLRPNRIESYGFSRSQRPRKKYVKHRGPSKLGPDLLASLTHHEVCPLRFDARKPDRDRLVSRVGQGEAQWNGLADANFERYIERE
jgi:hypothetical protein